MNRFWTLIRRTHTYLALLLFPWLVMYGVTAIGYNHHGAFGTANDLYNFSGPNWTAEETWPASFDIPAQGPIPKDVAAAMLRMGGIEAEVYGGYRLGANLVVAYVPSFWTTERLAYDLRTRELTRYRRAFVAQTTLTAMHARAGYQHESVINDAWAVAVDATMISILLWVATGLAMWWQQRRLRAAGGIALAAGMASFAWFVFGL